MTAPGPRSNAPEAPPAELVERLRQALARLWPGGRLGLAVSGGPDSLAMLLLAEAAIPGQFEVGTVDHGLRAGSADECAFVAEVCHERGIPCQVLEVTVAEGNLQAMARDARYAALADWAQERNLSAVATAHHADDQAETLLMRLNRGSGVSGLAGVRERGPLPGDAVIGTAIRPLLGFRRSELAEIVARSGLAAVQDPSNADDRFDRVRIRKALAENEWLDPVALAASASYLADADEAVGYAAGLAWSERVSPADDEIRYRPTLLAAIDLRIMGWAIRLLGKDARGRDLARLLERLKSRDGGNLAGVLVTAEGDEWLFRREPPRRTG